MSTPTRTSTSTSTSTSTTTGTSTTEAGGRPESPPAGAAPRKKLAVWKLASCDGCQLTILDCEDELLALAGAIEIAYFLEATSTRIDGPYDVSLVEGSVTTARDAERLREIRAHSRMLVTIGACATAGGIQALRNFQDVEGFTRMVYARPEYIRTLERSTAVADHVRVDFELRGCPIDRRQLLEVLSAVIHGRAPRTSANSVCVECKLEGNVCVTVARGEPCLGPVTQQGCGALCPSWHRGCYGCFGPVPNARTDALAPALHRLGMAPEATARLYRTFNTEAPAFRAAGDKALAQASAAPTAPAASEARP